MHELYLPSLRMYFRLRIALIHMLFSSTSLPSGYMPTYLLRLNLKPHPGSVLTPLVDLILFSGNISTLVQADENQTQVIIKYMEARRRRSKSVEVGGNRWKPVGKHRCSSKYTKVNPPHQQVHGYSRNSV